jgi:hypothetical protein
MRNIKRITTQDELTREIADTELEIERARSAIKNGWASLKDDMRPANLVRGIFSRPSSNSSNGVKTELPAMAAKMAAGFLINRWMVKKSYGMAKMTAGMLLQSGLAALLSKLTSKKIKKPVEQVKPLTEI